MTAKPGPDDLAKVKHHLYDIADLKDVTDFNVTKYQSLALECINDIHSRGKIPIVVGGTNYYIEALLFENLNSVAPNKTLTEINTAQCDVEIQKIYDDFFNQVIESQPRFKVQLMSFHQNIPPDNKQ